MAVQVFEVLGSEVVSQQEGSLSIEEREDKVRELSPAMMTRIEVLHAMDRLTPGGRTVVLSREEADLYDQLEARLRAYNQHPELEEGVVLARRAAMAVVR